MDVKRDSRKNIIRIALATGAVMLVPFVGNWPWTLGDFVIMGTLLFGAGLVYELVASKLPSTAHRIALGLGLGVVTVLIWIELAVGLFGTLFAGS
jgi:hypothetical protein